MADPSRRFPVLAALAAAGAIGTLATVAALAQENSLTPAPNTPPAATIPVEVLPPHWTEYHLKSLAAEGTAERSVYLSAVQMVEVARSKDTLPAVLPKLKRIADSSKDLALKNAVRRLLVQVAVELGDYATAESTLDKIVEDGLRQL